MANLFESLQQEIQRNIELKKQYEEIGQSGVFGATMIQRDIDAANKAIAEGDIIEELRIYETLKNNK